MKNNLFDTLKEVLKKDDRFISNEWDLLKNVIREKAINLDIDLIWLLLDNDILKNKFFIKIKDSLVFDSKNFIELLNNKEFLENSFTRFKNKVWLSNNQWDFLASSNEIVLSWPYKDCILAWWQDKEDTKRDEIFYNEILWSDDIDRLLDEKVFTNFKRIDKDWESELKEFKRDKEVNKKRGLSEDTITDNLLIKWNNLLALHSLKSNFAWKVKLIYIDPPYNTWNDSFKYNDRFNHSTWLTFMKNRLEVAKDLLKDDWVIFVQCDDNEQAYLKVLMDEVFWKYNFISNSAVIINRWWRDYGGIAKTHEYLLVFWKNELSELNMIVDENKKFKYKDDISSFDLMELRNRNVKFNDKNRPNLCYPFYVNVNNKDDSDLYELSLEKKDNYIEVYPLKSQWIQTVWRWWKQKAQENLNIELKGKMKQDWTFMIVQKYRKKTSRQKSIWEDKNYVNEKWTLHIKSLFNEKIFDYPKSEFLLKTMIELWTEKWNIVLDYHLWSGTTGAVAHKMGRQYIWIEQMDYIETISKERLKKVIDWEQWWISKSVEWKGGWDFVYMEIMEENERIIKEIEGAWNDEEIIKIYESLKDSEFINYFVDIKKIDENLKDENKKDWISFENLSLENKKRFLIELLDKNLLYKNYSEIKDWNSWVEESDRKMNEEFYWK